ncbi:MAG: shikimate dehydrogenase [Candidatus Helarchaeota archaeon]|nr:shikimate dehydrogenase [Candidatus Helarchaeota archaeon]
MDISGKTQLIALIGNPVEHSMSPKMHNAAFRELGLDYIYVALRVDNDKVKEAIQGIRAFNMKGANVTVPHKINAMQYLDEIDPVAENIGAINTILNKDGHLFGTNTDGIGAVRSLNEEGVNLKGKKIVMIGAGGVARPISYNFASDAKDFVLFDIVESAVQDLTKELNDKLGGTIRGYKLNTQQIAKELQNADIFINATPVGMHPKIDESIIPKKLLREDLVVFDVVYNPLETKLLKEAKAVGAKAISGMMMLVYQGVAAFELWTGKKAPVPLMKRMVLEGLGLG